MKIATFSKTHLAWVAVIALSSTAAPAQRNPQQVQPQMQQQQQMQSPSQQPGAGQMQAAPAAAPNSFCGNRPLCYDANDFAVTVTEFRTSVDARGSKILGAMLHFVNKTNQPISLGYVDQSGAAIDDMGNRYGLNTYGGGLRGMGVVAGNNMDPKFTLPPGGGGDARMEFWWAPYGKLAGVSYEVEFSVREMNRVEGNQWTLGDEALIHYQGLANGMGVAPVSGGNSFASGPAGNGAVSSFGSSVGTIVPGQASPGQLPQTTYVAAGQPCPAGTSPGTPSTAANVASTVGQQNQTANQAIQNASSAISSFGSLFGKKKAQPASTANAPATTPCVANTNGTLSPAVMRTAGGSPANTTNVNAVQAGKASAVPAAAAPAAPRTPQQPNRVVTNASMKQSTTATNGAKPSPGKPAAKSTSTSDSAATQSH